MAMIDRAPSTLLLSRAARATWWCGLPLLLLTCVFLGRDFYAVEPLYTLANALWRRSRLAAELVAEYPLSAIATLLLAGATLWSSRRRAAAVRAESLVLPTCIAGLEACARLSWFFACRGGIPTSRAELHHDLHIAATASLLAMAAPLFVGAILLATCPNALSGSLSRRSLLPVLAATASIALIWFSYDVLLRGYIAPQAP